MSWEPPGGWWSGWSQKYKDKTPGTDFAVGYAQGVEEAAGGPCEVSPSYSNDQDYRDGHALGMQDGASGHVKEPEELPWSLQTVDSPEARAQREEEERERESDENQEVMWEDGSVMTKREHEAKEIREGLERHVNPWEPPEPQEYGGEGGGGEGGPAIVE
jgi:hypothetical protein